VRSRLINVKNFLTLDWPQVLTAAFELLEIASIHDCEFAFGERDEFYFFHIFSFV